MVSEERKGCKKARERGRKATLIRKSIQSSILYRINLYELKPPAHLVLIFTRW